MWTAIEEGMQSGKPFYRIMTREDKEAFADALAQRIRSLKSSGFIVSEVNEKTYLAERPDSSFKIYAYFAEDPDDDTDLFSRFYLFRDDCSLEVCHDTRDFDRPRTLVYLHRTDVPSDKRLVFFMDCDLSDEAAVAGAMLKAGEMMEQ